MFQEIERQFERSARPLYGHLVSIVEAAITRGDLPSGSRLPPERELATRLRISRTTVVSAYRELESRGLLRGYVGRGTYVCAAPDANGTPFAWRGKIAAAALRAVWRPGSNRRRCSSARCRPASRFSPGRRSIPFRRASPSCGSVSRAFRRPRLTMPCDGSRTVFRGPRRTSG